MSSIPSVLRIPVADLGGAANDQSAVDALLLAMSKNRGEIGIVGDAGSFALFYRRQAMVDGNLRSVRVFRSPALHDEVGRFLVDEFKPLPPTKPQAGNFLTQWYYNLQAAAEDRWNDASRWVDLPWPETVKIAKAPDPRYQDNGYLVDDADTFDPTVGVGGLETLGVRVARQDEVDGVNRRAGYNPRRTAAQKANPRDSAMQFGEYIVDGIGRRRAGELIQGRGASNTAPNTVVPKRAGLVMPDDLLHGWTEAKALSLPNPAFGPGAPCEPGFRVEHPLASQITGWPAGSQPGQTIPCGTLFYSTMSVAQLNRLADTVGLTGALRASAINCGIGAAEFGIRELETGGITAIESVGLFNPEHVEGFAEGGCRTAADMWGLLFGGRLFTKDTTRVAKSAPIGARR